MKLTRLKVTNFRSLKNISLDIHDLTVLIGENDAGKSSVLDIIEMVLNDAVPSDVDYYKCLTRSESDEVGDECIEDEIEAILIFELDEWDKETATQYTSPDDGRLHLKKVYRRNGENKTYYHTAKFKDKRLENDFRRMNQKELQALIDELGILYDGNLNKEKRLDLLQNYMQKAEKEAGWCEITRKQLRGVLPIFQRYRAIDYKSPEGFVRQALELVYRDVIFEKIEGKEQPVESLQVLEQKVEDQIGEKLKELLAFIKKYYPSARQVKVDTRIDFTKGFGVGEFNIDDGRGLHPLSRRGDGTKRRMLMGILDWDRRVVLSLGDQDKVDGGYSLIRGYDEPDANLHYAAQSKMYMAISELVEGISDKNLRIQPIICTHSLTMIDRAPARKINLLTLMDDGCTEVDHLHTGDDEDIEDFLIWIAHQLGITNTMLFYERCYLIVEGETEEIALPRLYRKLYGTSLLDDGIKLINIHGSGVWKPFLSLLGKNKQEITVSLLDTDAKTDSRKKFEEAGFEMRLWEERTFWIGQQEFEDAFPDSVLCRCLNTMYPRNDKTSWNQTHIQSLRNSVAKATKRKIKFSRELDKAIKCFCTGAQLDKPRFGNELGRICDAGDIPQPIKDAFELARSIAAGQS